jgi:hypothetical protein
MKKLIWIVGTAVVVLLAALIVVPLLFRGEILELVKKEANKNLDATLDFDDLGLSVFRHFPRLTVTIDNARLINHAPFAGDTLLLLEKFQATVNPFDLIGGGQVDMSSMYLIHPRVCLRALADGQVNWDIARTAAEEIPPSDEKPARSFDLALQHYEIRDAQLLYRDEAAEIFLQLTGLQHEGQGDFHRQQFDLSTTTTIDSMTLQFRGIPYLDHVEVAVKADLDIDAEKKKYVFKENEVRLNELLLTFDGWATQVPEGLALDVRFRSPKTEFKSILSLVRAVFQGEFANLKIDGQLAVEGTIAGTNTAERIPAFGIDVLVTDGVIQHSSSPTPIEHIQLAARLENPGQTLDETTIALKKFHLEVLDEPFDIQGLISTPISAPDVDLSFAGSVNLQEVPRLLPLPADSGTFDFADLQLGGRLILRGEIDGVVADERVPRFDITCGVTDGSLSHPSLPQPLKRIQLDLRAQNPGGSLDETVIQVQKLHAEIENDSLEITAKIKTPVIDPLLSARLAGRINLARATDFLLAEGRPDVQGRVNFDVRIDGNVSAIRQSQWDKFTAAGLLDFSQVAYAAPDLPVQLRLPRAKLRLSPQGFILDTLECRYDKSDLQAKGTLENVFGYLFDNRTLAGTLTVRSDYCDLNPWVAGESQKLRAVELPERMELLLSAAFKEVLYDNLTITNATGNLLLKDRTLNLLDLKANTLQGTVEATGTYRYTPPEKPHLFMDVKAERLGIPEMFTTFVTVQRFVPIAQYMRGQAGGTLSIDADLDTTLLPVWPKFLSSGSLSVLQGALKDFVPLNKVAELLNLDRLRDPGLKDLLLNYHITDGRFFVRPTAFAVDQYQMQVSGSNGLDKSLDYLLTINIPAAELKAGANRLLSDLIKQDISALTDETVVVKVNIRGTLADPKIETSLADIVKGPAEQLKAAAVSVADSLKAVAEQEVLRKLDEQKQVLEQKEKEAREKLKDKLKDLFKKR